MASSKTLGSPSRRRTRCRLAPAAPAGAGHRLADDIATEEGGLLVVADAVYLLTRGQEVAAQGAQVVAGARADLHLRAGWRVRVPLDRAQRARVRQVDERRLQRHLGGRAKGVDLDLGDGAVVAVTEVRQGAPRHVDVVELQVAQGPRLELVLEEASALVQLPVLAAEHLPDQAAVGGPRAVGATQLVAEEHALVAHLGPARDEAHRVETQQGAQVDRQ